MRGSWVTGVAYPFPHKRLKSPKLTRPFLCLAEEIQDPVVDLLRSLDEHEVPNTLDKLGLGPFPQVGGHLFYLLLIEAVATIIRAVQVEDGLRDRAAPRGFLLRRPHGRAEADGIELPQ